MEFPWEFRSYFLQDIAWKLSFVLWSKVVNVKFRINTMFSVGFFIYFKIEYSPKFKSKKPLGAREEEEEEKTVNVNLTVTVKVKTMERG